MAELKSIREIPFLRKRRFSSHGSCPGGLLSALESAELLLRGWLETGGGDHPLTFLHQILCLYE